MSSPSSIDLIAKILECSTPAEVQKFKVVFASPLAAFQLATTKAGLSATGTPPSATEGELEELFSSQKGGEDAAISDAITEEDSSMAAASMAAADATVADAGTSSVLSKEPLKEVGADRVEEVELLDGFNSSEKCGAEEEREVEVVGVVKVVPKIKELTIEASNHFQRPLTPQPT